MSSDRSPSLSPASAAEYQALDQAHHLHPFTDPCALRKQGTRIITHAQGVYLFDLQGNRILDGMAGLWSVNLGYGREELIAAASAQMQKLAYCSSFFHSTHPPAVELAALIAELAPERMQQVFFCNSGSEANDSAMRLVRHYWQLRNEPTRQIIISRSNAYHGSTMASASLSGFDDMHSQGGLPIAGVEHIEQPHWYALGGQLDEQQFGRRAAQWLRSRIEALGAKNVAAFIAEPVQGAGGVIVPPENYWPEVQKVCDEFGVLLVLDEVICGFGRLGAWFGAEHYQLRPDLMTFAKGLSSGYQPIGGVIVAEHMANTLMEHGGELQHGFTTSGHPTCAAVAIENIRIMQREHIISYVHDDIGPYFQHALQQFMTHPLVAQVRGIGLMAAIQLSPNKKRRAPFAHVGEFGKICHERALELGLMMRAVDDAMVLSPPLVITHAEVDELIEMVGKSLDHTLHALQRSR